MDHRVLRGTARTGAVAALAALTATTAVVPSASARQASLAAGGRIAAARPCGVVGGSARSRAARIVLRTHTLTVKGTHTATAQGTDTLTVKGVNLAGKPDNGGAVNLFNVDNGDLSPTSGKFFHNGVAKFTVASGHYFAIGFFGSSSVPSRLVVLPQFTVTGNKAVTMREAAASSKVTMVTPRPATAFNTDLWLTRTAKSGPGTAIEVCVIGGALWISPTSVKPTVGTLLVQVNQHLESPPGPGVPYEYTLSQTDPLGTIPVQRYVVRQQDLATVHVRFYQAVKSSGLWAFSGVRPGTNPDTYFIEPEGPALTFPGRLTEYAGGTGTAHYEWGGQYEPFRQIAPPFSQGRSLQLRPGEHTTERFGAYPLHSAANVLTDPAPNPFGFFTPSAVRGGNTLGLDINPFDDNQRGHDIGSLFVNSPAKITGSYQIDENGTKVAGGDAVKQTGDFLEFHTQARLGPAPSTVRFALNLTRTSTDFPLSTSASTVWTWHSAHPKTGATLPKRWLCSPTSLTNRRCKVEPMMTLFYHVARLALNGSAPAGRQAVHLSVGHLQLAKASAITHASMSVSFDGGKTWHAAAVTGTDGRYTAQFTAPAGAKVTMRTRAADAAGGSITETITGAYQIGT